MTGKRSIVFDPDPSLPSWSCAICGSNPTELHRQGGWGHRVTHNPSRETRIREYVYGEVMDGYRAAARQMARLVGDGALTPEEALAAADWVSGPDSALAHLVERELGGG